VLSLGDSNESRLGKKLSPKEIERRSPDEFKRFTQLQQDREKLLEQDECARAKST
jgi:hypothetical protein